MKKATAAAGVLTAAAVLVGGAYAYPYVMDPVAACDRQAEKEHARIAEKLEVYSDIKLGEPEFLENCEFGELGAGGRIFIPRSVGQVEAVTMLGDDWEINDARTRAISSDGWRAYTRNVKVKGERVLEVELFP